MLRVVTGGGGGMPLHRVLTSSNGGSPGAQVLRFANPLNDIPTQTGITSVTDRTNLRMRMPFYVGTADMSQLVFSFNGWWFNGTDATNYGNDYDIVKMAIEFPAAVTGGAAQFVPVTFGGLRTQNVANGAVDVQSDPLLPSSVPVANLTKFAVGIQLWIRLEYEVQTVGQILPRNSSVLRYTANQLTGSVGATIGVGNNMSAVDATGNMTVSLVFTQQINPYTPLVLGKFVSGDPFSVIGIGDSIIAGQSNDQNSGKGVSGGFMRSLFDADLVSNPKAGCNFGVAGATAVNWAGPNVAKLTAFIKYAKYAVEEYGTNEYLVNPGTVVATALGRSQNIWSLLSANGITQVIRNKLIPRTTSTDAWITPTTLGASPGNQAPINTPGGAWDSGGRARQLNDALDTPGLGVAQGVVLHINNCNSLRIGTDQTQDPFYIWTAAPGPSTPYTADGIHGDQNGAPLYAADLKTAYATLP